MHSGHGLSIAGGSAHLQIHGWRDLWPRQCLWTPHTPIRHGRHSRQRSPTEVRRVVASSCVVVYTHHSVYRSHTPFHVPRALITGPLLCRKDRSQIADPSREILAMPSAHWLYRRQATTSPLERIRVEFRAPPLPLIILSQSSVSDSGGGGGNAQQKLIGSIRQQHQSLIHWSQAEADMEAHAEARRTEVTDASSGNPTTAWD